MLMQVDPQKRLLRLMAGWLMIKEERQKVNKTLLFVVNVDWFFVSHRLPIAIAALKAGYKVHLACGMTDKMASLTQLGIEVHPLPLSRGGTGIGEELKTITAIYKVIKSIKPDIVHTVTIKPVLYAGIISRLLRVPTRVASVSGLGYVFIDKGVKASIFRGLIGILYRIALRSNRVRVIFQNLDDRQVLLNLGAIKPAQVDIIRGSGVDLTKYQVAPEPSGVPVVMLLARLLIDKGVNEFVEAGAILKQRGIKAKMVLVGDIDEHNPKSITSDTLQKWVTHGEVEHWGFRHDVNEVLSQSNIVALPSYREGLPKSLIEAAACGRAVVTTDVPGCRDAITPDETGLLIPAKQAGPLADKIALLLERPGQRNKLASNGRLLAEQVFDIKLVVAAHLRIYQSLGD
jgi:glycosyltransferase involved in cell wall biosynthesis